MTDSINTQMVRSHDKAKTLQKTLNRYLKSCITIDSSLKKVYNESAIFEYKLTLNTNAGNEITRRIIYLARQCGINPKLIKASYYDNYFFLNETEIDVLLAYLRILHVEIVQVSHTPGY